jgi:hypothetical protein
LPSEDPADSSLLLATLIADLYLSGRDLHKGPRGDSSKAISLAAGILKPSSAPVGVIQDTCLNDTHKGRDLYKQSLALAWETGMYTIVLDDLVGFACLAGAQGDAVRAAQLCGAAEALYEATGYPQDPISHAEMEPYLASGRSKIHEAVWEEAWEEGRTMSLEEAVSYALEQQASG